VNANDGSESLLYYYTGIDGLIGILRDRWIYATDAMFLNDASEVAYAFNRMMARLAQYHPEYAAIPWLAELLDSIGSPAATSRDASVYVTSFCEEGDLLSQWRGYASGGYAIGFARDALHKITLPDGEIRVVPVSYGPNVTRPRVRKIFEDMIAHGPYTDVDQRRVRDTLLLPELAATKDPTFAEEREWRLMILGHSRDTDVQFRTRANVVIPYLLVPLPEPDPIRTIVIGPGHDSDIRQAGARRLLDHLGRADVSTRPSVSPLRD
jgi:hypothetical protein